MSAKRGGVLQVQDLLEKWAAKTDKKADAESGGPSSTHPTASAEDKTVPQSENEKKPSAENSAVLKEDNPLGPNEKTSKVKAAVDAARQVAGLPKRADEPNTNVGASLTGSKPESETPSAEDTGNDTGTSHPAHIDNPELGGKYSMLFKAAAEVDQLGEKIAAEIVAMASSPSLVSGAAPASAQAKFAEGKKAAASILDDPRAKALAKIAEDAAMIGHWTADYYDALKKQANEGMPMDPAMMGGAGGGMPPADPMAGGAPPAAPAAPAGGGGGGAELAGLGVDSPEELAQILGMLEQSGAPVQADGQGDEAELMALLQQMGITTPEQLQQLIMSLEGAAGGGGGGAGGMGGGDPAAAMAAPPPGGEAGGPPPDTAPSGSSDSGASEASEGGGESEKSEPSEKEAAAKQPSQDEALRKISAILKERLTARNGK